MVLFLPSVPGERCFRWAFLNKLWSWYFLFPYYTLHRVFSIHILSIFPNMSNSWYTILYLSYFAVCYSLYIYLALYKKCRKDNCWNWLGDLIHLHQRGKTRWDVELITLCYCSNLKWALWDFTSRTTFCNKRVAVWGISVRGEGLTMVVYTQYGSFSHLCPREWHFRWAFLSTTSKQDTHVRLHFAYQNCCM